MAWRAPYKTLCEMFPQVDVRIIRGTVLDHGSDLASAVEFIMNEVLTPEELNSASRESFPPAVLCVQNSERKPSGCGIMHAGQPQQQQEELLPSSENELPVPDHENATVLLSGINTEQGCTEQGFSVPFSSELLRRWLCEEADVKEQPAADDPLSENVPSSVLASLHESTAMLCSLDETSQLPEQGSKGHDGDTESEDEGANVLACRREEFSSSEQLVKLKKLMEVDSLEHSPISSGASSLSSGPIYKGYVSQLTYDLKDCDKDDLQNSTAQVSTPGHFELAKATSSGADEGLRALSELTRLTSSYEEGKYEEGKLEHVSNDVRDSHGWMGMASCLLGASELSKEENYSSVYSNLQDAMPSDDAMCESLNHSSSQAASIENLDQAFQHARNEKDDLIAAIEDIRLLRQELEQAGAAARQTKADAANGGVDILAKAQELRELVGQRRQANEIHAGEVYGEKAVLGTEARELRSRLSQVMEEKTKAFNHILQIKAILQSRLDIAIKERETAEAEKLEKETKAREVLTSEQALFDKVEQDSKELEAEAEACTKLRDFLIERGSSVDSIQGEVAILCEDVEALMQQVQGAASSQTGSIQGSSRSRSSKSSWNSVGLEPSAVGSSKSAQNSVEAMSPGVDGGSQTVECSGKDKKIGNVAETAFPEQRESPVPFATSVSGSSTGSVANSVSSKVVYDRRVHRTPIPSHVGSAGWLNPAREMGDQAPTLFKWDLPKTSVGESTSDPFPVGVDIHDTEAEERLAYEARMAMLPGASLFGAPKETFDLFRMTKRKETDNDGWQILY